MCKGVPTNGVALYQAAWVGDWVRGLIAAYHACCLGWEVPLICQGASGVALSVYLARPGTMHSPVLRFCFPPSLPLVTPALHQESAKLYLPLFSVAFLLQTVSLPEYKRQRVL